MTFLEANLCFEKFSPFTQTLSQLRVHSFGTIPEWEYTDKPFSEWFCSFHLRGRNDWNSIPFIPELECYPKERILLLFRIISFRNSPKRMHPKFPSSRNILENPWLAVLKHDLINLFSSIPVSCDVCDSVGTGVYFIELSYFIKHVEASTPWGSLLTFQQGFIAQLVEHRYRGGHGFKSRWSLRFLFWAFLATA